MLLSGKTKVMRDWTLLIFWIEHDEYLAFIAKGYQPKSSHCYPSTSNGLFTLLSFLKQKRNFRFAGPQPKEKLNSLKRTLKATKNNSTVGKDKGHARLDTVDFLDRA